MMYTLCEHSPEWSRKYEKMMPLIRSALGTYFLELYHIGSTSIPQIKAKPIVDMLCVVSDIEEIDHCNAELRKLGFRAMGEFGIPKRRFFESVEGDMHLHVFQEGNPEIMRHLLFKEYLLAHPEQMKVYETEKQRLFEEFPEDREAYTRGKTRVVREIDERAKEWKEGMCE